MVRNSKMSEPWVGLYDSETIQGHRKGLRMKADIEDDGSEGGMVFVEQRDSRCRRARAHEVKPREPPAGSLRPRGATKALSLVPCACQ